MPEYADPTLIRVKRRTWRSIIQQELALGPKGRQDFPKSSKLLWGHLQGLPFDPPILIAAPLMAPLNLDATVR
ncbi:MAG: hypothetical protein CFE28_02105 [Alphaproteobacteria bacterium PA2]|nr:MAG: hypothetical protein CFE28_02105 [Alphaproteobacteria bacterium PA2]